MNKKSLLLALITGTAPLIAAEKPSQVLESLMQPLPSTAINIQARAAVYPALRQIPSGACAFVSMANVQDNITKLLNNRLVMLATEGESAKSIATIPPIESIAFSFDPGAEANIAALLDIGSNLSGQILNTAILQAWIEDSKEEYKASITPLLKPLEEAIAKSSIKGINKGDINLPEMRCIVTMKAGSEAIVAELKQNLDAELAKKALPIPAFNHEGYTVISLPLAMGVAMIPDLPEGSMDALIKSQHYLALKFEGNSICVVYSRDLEKIHIDNIEQSMLASDKLNLSDAQLQQGIITCSFLSAELINTLFKYEQHNDYSDLLQAVFESLAEKHPEQALTFKASALATAQANQQIIDLKQSLGKQVKIGNYSNLLWRGNKLNYMEVLDYQGAWNFTSAKLNAWDRIDLAETICYGSISPMSSSSICFNSKAFLQNVETLVKGASLTLNENATKELQIKSEELEKNREIIQTSLKALGDIREGLEGSITLYSDNKVEQEEDKKDSSDPAPRYSYFSAVRDQSKLISGIKACFVLAESEYKLGSTEIISDKFFGVSNSAALNQSLQSELSQSSSSKEFAGGVFYFNGQAVLPLIKDEDEEAKEFLQLAPKVYSVFYPKDGKLIFRALLK